MLVCAHSTERREMALTIGHPIRQSLKLCNTNIMPPASPAYGWCLAIIFNIWSSRDATAVCGTVCKPPRQAYVILFDVDCGGSDLIIDRPKAPTTTKLHTSHSLFYSFTFGHPVGESAAPKSSESLLIRWVRDWFVFTPSYHQHLAIYVELDHRAFLWKSTTVHIIFLSFEGRIPHLRRHRRYETSI